MDISPTIRYVLAPANTIAARCGSGSRTKTADVLSFRNRCSVQALTYALNGSPMAFPSSTKSWLVSSTTLSSIVKFVMDSLHFKYKDDDVLGLIARFSRSRSCTDAVTWRSLITMHTLPSCSALNVTDDCMEYSSSSIIFAGNSTSFAWTFSHVLATREAHGRIMRRPFVLYHAAYPVNMSINSLALAF